MNDDRRRLPIAVFDSGVGGLTVLHECLVSLPHENFLYLGDEAGFPYGTKPRAEVRERVGSLVTYLLDRGAKLLVVACNSATTAALDLARAAADEHGVVIVSVLEPEAEIAAAITESGRIGVLATPLTVEGGGYRQALERQARNLGARGPALEVTEVEAGDLAPIIQDGFPIDEHLVERVRAYCAPLKRARVDTVILGCTHFPLIAPMLQRILGRDVRLVTAGHAIAATVQRTLEARELDSTTEGEGTYRFLCTGDPETFRELGTRFLQLPLGEVERVPIG